MTKDYYKILGVAEFDTAENIKSAYRKLARVWHPDVAGNSEEALARFKEINEAYETLSNKVKKAEYDKARKFYNYAHDNFTTSEKAKTENNSTNPQSEKRGFSFNWEEILGKKYRETSFKDEKIRVAKRGEDIHSDIDISIFEAVGGVVKTINMLQTSVCQNCKGKKFVNGVICHACNGKGEFTDYKKFSIKIPAGVKNGSKIRLAGEGGKGINGGENGDLYITIHVKEPATYKTEGLNILKTIPITPFEAVLGTNIKISTVNGVLNVKIAPNTQNGQKIRLAGCGIVQNNHVGDMIVTVEIRIPKNLSEEEINLYKRLGEISSTNIREDI